MIIDDAIILLAGKPYKPHRDKDGNWHVILTIIETGGQGGLDLWISERSKDGDWEPAKNLGSVINSPYSEETPFFTEDGKKIYFSSEGHATMGGYDIFFSELLPNGRWSEPENPGYPVSTSDDDLFFVPVNNGQKGYLSTILPDSVEGGWNIYTLRFVLPGEFALQSPEELNEPVEEEVLAEQAEPDEQVEAQEEVDAQEQEEQVEQEEQAEQEEQVEQTEETEPVPVEEEAHTAPAGNIIPEPDRAIYTIQIMALKRPVEVSYFKPLQGVNKYSGEDGFHRYVYGEYMSVEEALKKLPALTKMGYADAFIMRMQHYQRISE